MQNTQQKITYQKIADLAGLSKSAVKVYMASYRLARYLTQYRTKRSKRPFITVVKFNADFINDFAYYLKIKGYENSTFITKANKLLAKNGK